MTELLPKHFCWTRFGTEAGEPIDAILRRKEREREQNGGTFLWGIGNALGPSMRELLNLEEEPEVVFSPMLTPPRQVDVSPSAVMTWQSGRDLLGAPVRLPKWSCVTSRASAGSQTLRHYALVCYSESPLFVSLDPPRFSVRCLENLLTRRQVGASQVTAVVRRAAAVSGEGASYRAAFRARLVSPFFIELAEPRLSSRSVDRRAVEASTPHRSGLGGALSP